MNTCSIYTMVLPDHTATTMVDFFSPSKINGMSRRITIYESTPKKARSFPKQHTCSPVLFNCSCRLGRSFIIRDGFAF